MGMPVIIAKLAAADAPALEEVLKPGASVIGRVAREADNSGQGAIIVAGSILQAKIPRGLKRGQQLALKVGKRQTDKLTLRFEHDDVAAPVSSAYRSRLAGRMATRGRAAALKVALALRPDGVIELPNGDVATVRIYDQEKGEDREEETDEEDCHSATFTLHSPSLGAISVELVLTPSTVTANVVADPGEAEYRVEDAQDELMLALAQVLNRPASVAVSARSEEDALPTRPQVTIDVVDAYA